jgi:hypothetical protein
MTGLHYLNRNEYRNMTEPSGASPSTTDLDAVHWLNRTFSSSNLAQLKLSGVVDVSDWCGRHFALRRGIPRIPTGMCIASLGTIAKLGSFLRHGKENRCTMAMLPCV